MRLKLDKLADQIARLEGNLGRAVERTEARCLRIVRREELLVAWMEATCEEMRREGTTPL